MYKIYQTAVRGLPFKKHCCNIQY